MCKLKTMVIILFSVSLVSISNAASIIYVDVNGPNDPGTGTFDDPFRKIQDAIEDANDGDTIEIRPGLYSGDRNYDLDPNGLAITIRSKEPNDPNIVADTIIDPNRAGRGFYFHSGEDANCIVSGLTIRNGHATGNSGGAIYCSESDPTIDKCVIINNVADDYGGAIFCYYSSPSIRGCTISDNSAIDGGVLECGAGNPLISNCIMANNVASNFGGAVDCYYLGNPKLTNCTIVKNSANSGGGLCCVDSEATVYNCILWANEAAQGGQIALEEPFVGASIASVSYSDVQDGQAGIYVGAGCTLVWDANSNMSTDPCFASFDANGDPNKWDLHVQSVYRRWDPNSQDWLTDSNTSACIDAGDPNSTWSSEPWPNGKRINMGGYGGTEQASMNGNPSDFDIDGLVDFMDFAEFSNKWFAQEFCIEDLTNNGVVDFADLAIFVKNWLWQKE